MLRRSLLAASASAALPRVAIAQPAASRTLVFVPQANLTSLDPIWTTATVTRNFGYVVFDTLYGTDDALVAQPQMAAGHRIEDDGKRWTITLRDGLRFHNGEPVRGRDVVASLRRWMRRDSLGSSLADLTDELAAPDDKTVVFRLKRAFPPLALALGKTQPSPAFIMPEAIAGTDPFQQITEVVGSGPFRFVADEYVPSSRAMFARFDRYEPRAEAPSSLAGGKRALVDRLEWRIIPEPATAANALVAGEIDWLEMPLTDLLPMLRRAPGVTVGQLDPYGLYPVLRPNHLQGPTANLGVRQAILAAIDSREAMQAIMGDDQSAYRAPVGSFLPGTPYANDAGFARLGPQPADRVRAMLAASGYKGEPLVVMHPTDQPFYDAMTQVAVSALRNVGFTIDDQALDWGTVVQRRGKKDGLAAGGWSLFVTSFPALDYADPLAAPGLRGTGGKAWYGWPTDEKIEGLRQQFIDTGDPAARAQICRAIQAEALESVLYVPLGQYFQSAAWRSNLTGQLKGQPPIFWNVQKG